MLLEAIEQLFPDHNFKWDRHGSFAKGFCPLHKNDHTPAFAVYVDAKGNEKWHCFAEDIGGNLFDIVRLSGIPGTDTIVGANHWLMQKGYIQETEQQKEARERNDALLKFYKWTNELLCKSKEAAGVRAYLASRHIDAETLPLAAVGYYPTLKEVRNWLLENDLNDILGSVVCVPEAKSILANGSIMFFYKSSYSEISRIKIRNINMEKGKDKKTLFLGAHTSKREKPGYFSWWMDAILPTAAILVEGEFDVGALACLTTRDDPHRREPIYCFGGGGNIAGYIDTMKNIGLDNIYIFPDNDEPGTNYAADIAENFPDTYTLFPEDYKQGMDPADWSADHTYEDLQQAFVKRCPAFVWIGQQLAERYSVATIEDQAAIKTKIIDYGKKLSPTNRESFIKAFGTLAGVSLESVIQEIEESSMNTFRKSLKSESFGVWMNKSVGKNPDWKLISNVILEHVEDVVLDDYGGEEGITRNVTIKATTVNQTKLITMPTEEFIDDRKLKHQLTTALGTAAVLIEPRMESHLRNSMIVLDPRNVNGENIELQQSLIYLHTGWRDGKYYTNNGYIDSEGFHKLDDIKVSLPDNPRYFKNYYLSEPPADLEPVKKVIREDLLQVFPYEITLPFFAHIFWTVLSDFIPMAKPYALWVVGQTGSFKTSYTGVMTSFFGDFKMADFETWRSTVNAIEMNGFYLKDSPFVIDDYKPVDIDRKEVTRCIQNYADRHGRARMKMGRSNTQERTYWIRGNMIITAEDVPPEGETSIAARTLELRVPTTGSSSHLTNAQVASKLFPGVMTKFIQFICNKHLNIADYERLLSERRQQYQAIHARVRENLAANSIAWDFVAEFFGFQDLTPLYKKGLENILENMNAATKSQLAGEVFLESIRTLLATGTYYFEGCNGFQSTPHVENAHKLGWIDDKGVYLIGQETLAEVNKLRLQVTGSPMNYTMRSIYDQLLANHVVIPDAKGHVAKVKHIDGFSYRVIEVKRGVVEEFTNEALRDHIEPQTAVVRDPRPNTTT